MDVLSIVTSAPDVATVRPLISSEPVEWYKRASAAVPVAAPVVDTGVDATETAPVADDPQVMVKVASVVDPPLVRMSSRLKRLAALSLCELRKVVLFVAIMLCCLLVRKSGPAPLLHRRL